MDADTWLLLYKGLDIPIIIAVCIIAQYVKPVVRKRWRPLTPIVLGMLAAFAVQDVSPYPMTLWNTWRRVLTYGAGAAAVYSLRNVWMPKGMQNGGGT